MGLAIQANAQTTTGESRLACGTLVAMSLFYQALVVFAAMILIMGYFQYRRGPDVITIAQEMFRPQYLVPAIIITICYVIIKVILTAFDGVI